MRTDTTAADRSAAAGPTLEPSGETNRAAELSTGCCSPSAQVDCCAPSQKQACCDTGTESGTCGCRA